MVTYEMLPSIEKALGFKLLPFQKAYLVGNTKSLGSTRASGRTTAYCIKWALSEGPPLDMKKVHEFSDMQHLSNHRTYASHFFKHMFLDIRDDLQRHGFKVREVKP